MNSDEKTLVVYFSRAGENYNVGTVEVGNTELLAKEIVAKTGAYEFKIVPTATYPENYQEAIEKATEERKAGARPDYEGDGFNMSGSTARTDNGIKKLDNWLEELGY